MTGNDRGTERRRLLEAVRNDGSSEGSTEEVDRGSGLVNGPDPAPDGGVVALDGPLYHCTNCDRTYLEEPASCDSCGEPTFESRTA